MCNKDKNIIEDKKTINTIENKFKEIVNELVEYSIDNSKTYQEAIRYIDSLAFISRTDEIRLILKSARATIRYLALKNEIE